MKLKLLFLASGIIGIAIGLSAAYTLSKKDIKYIVERQPLVQRARVLGYSFRRPEEYYVLPAAKWVPQTFNNCGPAAVSMTLQYFGHSVPQTETKARLRTGDDDKNIFMYQISDYLKEFDIESKIFFNGDIEMVKTLVSNGFYVIVEDWLRPYEDIGHVLIIRGYDDRAKVLIGDDPYLGVGVRFPYQEFEEGQWKPFNREFVPVYSREKEELLKAIVGENWNESTMYRNSVIRNQKDIEENPNDMYAWFNLGTSYFALAEYENAKEAFEKSRQIGWPGRMLWYQIEPIETYNKLGEYQKAIELANIALAGNESFIEVQQEKEFALEKLGF